MTEDRKELQATILEQGLRFSTGLLQFSNVSFLLNSLGCADFRAFHVTCYVCITYCMLHVHFILHTACPFHIAYYMYISYTYYILHITYYTLHITHKCGIAYDMTCISGGRVILDQLHPFKRPQQPHQPWFVCVYACVCIMYTCIQVVCV